MPKIQYPYIPKGKEIKFVTLKNVFMQKAKEISNHSNCVKHPSGAIVVKGRKIIGKSSNTGRIMKECPRWGSPTGTNYEPCKTICGREHHSEVSALLDAKDKNSDANGADLYLYGHWWCCENCWNEMIAAGIKDVYLLKNSWSLFNPEINKAMKEWGKPKNYDEKS